MRFIKDDAIEADAGAGDPDLAAATEKIDAHGEHHAHTPVGREVLEALPPPDYDEFFTEAARVGLAAMPEWRTRVFLPFESSRGCWWGQKHHCTFRGLNGEGMAYRARSADAVYKVLKAMVGRYPSQKDLAFAIHISGTRARISSQSAHSRWRRRA